MTLDHARTMLDKIRDGQRTPYVSLAETTQALQRTGDIPELHGSTLRFNGDEPCNDRAVEVESKGVEKGFSYSAYLNCQQNQGIKE